MQAIHIFLPLIGTSYRALRDLSSTLETFALNLVSLNRSLRIRS